MFNRDYIGIYEDRDDEDRDDEEGDKEGLYDGDQINNTAYKIVVEKNVTEEYYLSKGIDGYLPKREHIQAFLKLFEEALSTKGSLETRINRKRKREDQLLLKPLGYHSTQQ